MSGVANVRYTVRGVKASPPGNVDRGNGLPYLLEMTPVGLRVRELREAKGLTQEELAAKAEVRRATLSAIENSQTKGVDFDTLDRIARVLGVEPGFLIVRRR